MNKNVHDNNHESNQADHDNGHQHHDGNNQDHDHSDHHAHMVADFRRRFWISLVTAIPIVLLSPMIQQFMGVSGQWDFAGDAYIQFGFSTIVFFWELATLIIIMLLGHWMEMRSVMGASGALEELVKLMPSTALRITKDGKTEEVKVSQLEKGDRIAFEKAMQMGVPYQTLISGIIHRYVEGDLKSNNT
jgi:P-type Cu2+ transporter